jgi:hypothetical protein
MRKMLVPHIVLCSLLAACRESGDIEDHVATQRRLSAHLAADTEVRLRQIAEAITVFTAEHGRLPSPATLVRDLKEARLALTDDWLVTITDGQTVIVDAWNRPIVVRKDEANWTLLSAGANGRFEEGRGDDLHYEIRVVKK